MQGVFNNSDYICKFYENTIQQNSFQGKKNIQFQINFLAINDGISAQFVLIGSKYHMLWF